MTLSNLTSASAEASVSSGTRGDASTRVQPTPSGAHTNNPATPATPTMTTNNTSAASGQPGVKRKRNLPGTPDPDAEVIALSPKTLMATNRFVCEICNKGFQRDQNLQLHRRGHNLPWKLRQRTSKEIRKRVYICPEPTCVHHDPSRALGDLTGIKKHFCRKHGEKKWKCDKCSKRYAVQSDWKAHSKTCGTREYRCDCGTLFSRRDSFITHRAFCDALAEESARVSKSGQVLGDQSIVPGPSIPGMQVMGDPQSPRCQGVGRIGVVQLDPLSGNTPPRPGLPGNLAGIGIGEGGGLSIPPARWGQVGSGSVPTTPGTARLSLWSGPGPGPPGLISSPQLHLGGSSQINPVDTNSPFLMQPPKIIHGSAVASMMSGGGSGDFDISQAPPRPPGGVGAGSGIMQLPPSGPGSILVNLFSSGSGHGLPAGIQQSGAGQSSGNMQMANLSGGFSDFTGGPPPTRLDRGGSGAAGLSLSSSAGMTSSSCSANNGAGTVPSVSSILNQQQHTSVSQMSATALLQKAAQMGATTSNSSLLRGYGMGGGPGGQGGCGQGSQGNENNSIALGTLWQEQNRRDQGRTGPLPPVSTGMGGLNHPLLRRAADPSPGSQGIGSSLPPPSFGGQGTASEHQEFVNSLSQFSAGSMSQGLGSSLPPPSFGGVQGRATEHQEFMNSLTQFTSGGVGSLPPMYPSPLASNSGNDGGMIAQTSPMKQHRMQGGENLGQQQPQQKHGVLATSSQSQAIPPLPGISPKSEDGGDRFTRDFLGVGATTTNIPGIAISQREHAGTATPGPGGVDVNFSKQQQRSVGPSSGQPLQENHGMGLEPQEDSWPGAKGRCQRGSS